MRSFAATWPSYANIRSPSRGGVRLRQLLEGAPDPRPDDVVLLKVDEKFRPALLAGPLEELPDDVRPDVGGRRQHAQEIVSDA